MMIISFETFQHPLCEERFWRHGYPEFFARDSLGILAHFEILFIRWSRMYNACP